MVLCHRGFLEEARFRLTQRLMLKYYVRQKELKENSLAVPVRPCKCAIKNTAELLKEIEGHPGHMVGNDRPSA